MVVSTTPDAITSPDTTMPFAVPTDLAVLGQSVQDALVRRSWYYIGTETARLALAAPDLRNGIIWEDLATGRTWQYRTNAWVEKDLVRNLGRINPVTAGTQTNITGTRTKVTGTDINITLAAPTLLRFYGNVVTYSTVATDVVVVSVADNTVGNNLFDSTQPANSAVAGTSRGQTLLAELLVPAGAHNFFMTVFRVAGSGTVTVSPGAKFPTSFSVDRIG